MLTSIKTRRRVPKHERALIDTSVLIDLEQIDPEHLPPQITIAAVTLAELAAGPHATRDANERARRQERLQRTEATFAAIAFDRDAARAYGLIFAASRDAGRSSRARFGDYLIAATAVAAGLPLYTRNPTDFEHLEHLLEVVKV
jgi:predicted nucleic acid-binding protein